MEHVRFLFAALAVYRLAFMLREDDGPLFLFERLRRFTDRKRQEKQQIARTLHMLGEEDPLPFWADSGLWASLDEGIRCPYCMGIWAALLAAALVLWPTPPGDALLLWLGLAGAQAFLESRSDR